MGPRSDSKALDYDLDQFDQALAAKIASLPSDEEDGSLPRETLPSPPTPSQDVPTPSIPPADVRLLLPTLAIVSTVLLLISSHLWQASGASFFDSIGGDSSGQSNSVGGLFDDNGADDIDFGPYTPRSCLNACDNNTCC